MLERDAATLDVSAQITRTRMLHPREATRVLTDAVVVLSDGALADDATLMVLDWHGGHGASRRTTAGAEQGRTSPVISGAERPSTMDHGVAAPTSPRGPTLEA